MHFLLLLFLAAVTATAQSPLDSYNIVWTTPSKDSSGSMPLGNGDIGINAWMEESGDLVFYVGKTDAWSESIRLLKLGRVRMRLQPNPFTAGQPFTKTLNLRTGEILITGGRNDLRTRISLWVDANHPVIRLEAETGGETEMQVFYERWRDQQRVLEGAEAHSAYGLDGGPEPVISYGDALDQEDTSRVVWYHYNARSAFAGIMKHQGLSELLAITGDPIQGRIFGASLMGAGFAKMNATAIRSQKAAKQHTVSIHALTLQNSNPETWVRQIRDLANRTEAIPAESRRKGHEAWWQKFWDTSHIRVTGGRDQRAVTQGWVLQRFLNACGGRGAYPIKFNGSIFTVDARLPDASFDADYRRWGGPYWFQNTRLTYWPMLASGDFDLMQPFFRMYWDARVLAERRTKLYFNHEGLYYPETMYFWGAYANSNYGWKRDGKPASFIENTYVRHHYNSSLELLAMMLDYHHFTQDRKVREQILQLGEKVLLFFDKHFERESGKLSMKPAQALETWQDVVNPANDIAGLRYVIDQMLGQRLPLDKNLMALVRRLQSQLPDLPKREQGGKTLLAAAEKINGEIKNSENPELYSIFPFRLFGVERPELELARETFAARRFKESKGWRQDAIQAAYLGLADEARTHTVANFTTPDPGSRFPGFYGPNFDWVPDQDHGSVATMALQSMLMQYDGNRVLLFPAWPKGWDVEFKLHAPRNTVIEGAYRNGKLEQLKVTPESRRSDVVQLTPQ